jgi:hypothetical protein
MFTDTPPRSSCPPCFAFDTDCESRIAPAHVPHTTFVRTNSRSGSKRPEDRARSAMVVDSGPRVNSTEDSVLMKAYHHRV